MKRIAGFLAIILLAGCGGPKQPQGPALVVFATQDDPAGLAPLLAEFTDETGIALAVEWGSSSDNADRIIEKSGLPADVLITDNVVDIWRAAEEGGLRPITSEAMASVDPHLRDPDGFWTVLQRRFIVIAVADDASIQNPGGYIALGGTKSDGRLCLSSLQNSVNRALIAMLIEDQGLKKTERLVRSWMMKLPMPPFATEEELLDAIEAGSCDYGIVSGSLVASRDVKNIRPVPLYADISAVGIARHATQPDRAQEMVDWLLRNHPPASLAQWNGRNIGVIGWRDEDVRLLAERVGYR